MAGFRAVIISSRCSAQAAAHILFESKAKYLYISEDAAVQRLAASAREYIKELSWSTPQSSPIYPSYSASDTSSGIIQFQLPNYTALYNAYDDGDIHFQQRLDTIAALSRRSDVAFTVHTSGKMFIRLRMISSYSLCSLPVFRTGTTGTPKPVNLTHEILLHWASYMCGFLVTYPSKNYR
jgi:long-subunit acyl-CoA synthetase (AMP-forming)